MPDTGVHVIKLGGSLLGLPDLLARLEAYRAAHVGPSALLVVGGGDVADVVRAFDQRHGLDEQTGHWLAVRAMQLNAHLLVTKLARARLVADAAQCAAAWQAHELAVMDPLPWLAREEQAGIHIPHHWQYTSDSIAAHMAHQLDAARLTLLKSTQPTGAGATVGTAARAGVVDEAFPMAAKGLALVEVVNLRADATLRPCVLQADA